MIAFGLLGGVRFCAKILKIEKAGSVKLKENEHITVKHVIYQTI